MELRKVRLGEIIDEYISGDWGYDVTSEEALNGVFCIRGADIVPIANSDYTNIPLRYISNHSKNKRLLKAGDLVIEKSGGSPTQSTGRMAIVSEELIKEKKRVVCSNFCTAIRLKAGWNPLYVYYYWTLAYNSGVFFNFEGKTSGLRNLNLDLALSSIEIKQATSDEQNKLVGLLSDIDRKIALNRRMNATLEAMARQLYDYWFLQFDFPDAHGKPYKSSGGKMVWNDQLKREIPEGWSVENLTDFADIKNGATPSTTDESNYGGDIVWITPKDLSDQQSKFIYHGERNITKQGLGSCSTSLLPINSILMSSRAPIGLVSIAKHEVCTNQGFKSFVPHNVDDSIYLYYYIKCHIRQIEQLGSGTTFKEVSREDLSKFPILVVGANKAYKQWIRIQKEIADKQFILTKEIDSLTRLRTTLLPLLMNGQVSVEEPQ